MFRSGNRSDKKLHEKIEDQEQKIVRYENRLRDVVQAYKSLQKEKEALESTVKALSSNPSQDGRRKPRPNENSPKKVVDKEFAEKESDSNDENEGRIPVNEGDLCKVETDSSSKEDGNEGEDSLNQKISTLSKALATLTEEKSKMAAAFQNDRKFAIQEHEKRLREAEEQMEVIEAKNSNLESQIKELKARLRQQQIELQAEQENSSIMLKEMQQLLSAERLEKEELKIRLQERRESDKTDSSKKAYELRIQELSDELATVSMKLRQVETDAVQPSSLLLQLSDEMIGLKKYHSDTLMKEQMRVHEAEETLKRFSSMEEERIAQLEAKLTELSDVVSSYEKLRCQDQLVIHKLKDKLSRIDSTMINPTAQQQLTPLYKDFSSSNQLSDLKEQVLKLKGLLRLAWNNKAEADQAIETEPITVAELDSMLHNDPSHRACQLEYKQLKDEFEGYKTENKRGKMNQPESHATESEELKMAKMKSIDLENELNDLRKLLQDKEQDYFEAISNLQCEVTAMEEKHSTELEKLKEASKADVLTLETQISKQRDRTFELVADKDAEIARLKGDPLASPVRMRTFESNSAFQSDNAASGDVEAISKRSFETEAAVRQLLTRQNSAEADGTMLYYVQQMSHYQTEIAKLRNKNAEFESLLRDEDHREEQYVEQLNALKQEIRRLERNRSRENANLEYLKNVVLQYILSDSFSVKQQLTTTIATILQFSQTEVNDIRKRQSSWWPSQ